MNLKQYLKQSERLGKGSVILEKSDYIILDRKPGSKLINIPVLHKRFKIDGNYILTNDCPILYTCDDQGNKKHLSVFSIRTEKRYP